MIRKNGLWYHQNTTNTTYPLFLYSSIFFFGRTTYPLFEYIVVVVAVGREPPGCWVPKGRVPKGRVPKGRFPFLDLLLFPIFYFRHCWFHALETRIIVFKMKSLAFETKTGGNWRQRLGEKMDNNNNNNDYSIPLLCIRELWHRHGRIT